VIPLEAESFNDGVNSGNRHLIHCFRGTAWRESAIIPVEFAVSREEQFTIEQEPIDSFQRQSLFPSFSNDF